MGQKPTRSDGRQTDGHGTRARMPDKAKGHPHVTSIQVGPKGGGGVKYADIANVICEGMS